MVEAKIAQAFLTWADEKVDPDDPWTDGKPQPELPIQNIAESLSQDDHSVSRLRRVNMARSVPDHSKDTTDCWEENMCSIIRSPPDDAKGPPAWENDERDDKRKDDFRSTYKWNQFKRSTTWLDKSAWSTSDDSSDDSGIDIPGKQGSSKQHKKTSTAPVIQNPKSWEYAKEVDRLLSLRSWPQLVRFNPAEFSREGFYRPKSSPLYAHIYPIKRDVVECFACGVRLFSWNPLVDTVYAEHKKHSPNCPMVKERGNYTCNEPIVDDETRKLLLATIYKQ